MSIRALGWALDQPIYSIYQKFTLVVLANYCSDTGIAYPKASTLVEVTGMSMNSVRRSLDKLEAEGFIIDTGKRAGGTGQIKVYRLPEGAWKRHPSGEPSLAAKTPQRHPKDSPQGCLPYIEGNQEPGTVAANGSQPTANGDETFLADLGKSEAYKGIDVMREYAKMVEWCRVTRNKPSKRRLINWLNKIDQPMTAKPEKRYEPNI